MSLSAASVLVSHPARALASCWIAASLGGCAINLSEARPARVLRGGEIQVSQINSVVVPSSALQATVDSAKALYSDVSQKKLPSDGEARELAGKTAAIALSGPGYATHLDIGIGLGYRWDTALRVGNGIYAASLRRGVDWSNWAAALGVRVAYNSGQTWVPYIEDLNSYVDLTATRRIDSQVFAQMGRELREWGRVWLGAKAMYSAYRVTIDATQLGLGVEAIGDHLWYYGGNLGVAIGYRFAWFVMELNVMGASGKMTAYGVTRDLGGITVSPAWGFLGQF